MKRPVLLLAVFLLVFWLSFGQTGRPRWLSIKPLQSTRADVERLLGPSTDKCRCSYKTESEAINVEYSEAACKGQIPGWNVPANTVLRFTVYPKEFKRFSEVKLDLANYQTRQDDSFTKYYFNRVEGIQYSVSPQGDIRSITYAPSSDQVSLRCDGFPETDGSFADYVRWDQYGALDAESESARLDSFVIMLGQRKDLKGYMVVYAGRVACLGEARVRGVRARNYLIKTRGLDPTRIVVIDGGHRKESLVELYAIPQYAEPPTAVPTIAAGQVKTIKGGRCRFVTR